MLPITQPWLAGLAGSTLGLLLGFNYQSEATCSVRPGSRPTRKASALSPASPATKDATATTPLHSRKSAVKGVAGYTAVVTFHHPDWRLLKRTKTAASFVFGVSPQAFIKKRDALQLIKDGTIPLSLAPGADVDPTVALVTLLDWSGVSAELLLVSFDFDALRESLEKRCTRVGDS